MMQKEDKKTGNNVTGRLGVALHRLASGTEAEATTGATMVATENRTKTARKKKKEEKKKRRGKKEGRKTNGLIP